MLIDWTPDLPTVSLSDWATFNADAAVSVIDKSQNGTSGITIGKTNLSPPPQPYTGSYQLSVNSAAAGMYPGVVTITSTAYVNGQVVYLAWEGTYTRMLRADGVSKYLPGDFSGSAFDANAWDTYWAPGSPFSLV